jgi:hypothetical protein
MKKPATQGEAAGRQFGRRAPLALEQRYASLSWIISSRRLNLCIFTLRDFSATR